MSSPSKIELYFDLISPYSYLAFNILLRLRHVWNIELILKPFSLPHIMIVHN